ncbi:hypothetical protein F8M41_004559 [Gigaspora margarita]|uniref:Uncharacterized protein n=1 Tax=Gigaspora margarita TaxID=4874 RepID=A0A8H3XC47_GIGMA|nr:hypothetical protein F8M41_004559 [Gigaspora margarita]
MTHAKTEDKNTTKTTKIDTSYQRKLLQNDSTNNDDSKTVLSYLKKYEQAKPGQNARSPFEIDSNTLTKAPENDDSSNDVSITTTPNRLQKRQF